MSTPVILGFTTSAAILIGASQIGSAMGVEDVGEDLLGRLVTVVGHPDRWNWQAIGLTVLVGALVVGGRRVHALFPGVLIAVLIGLWIGSESGYNAALVGDIPEGLPPFSLSFPWSRLPDLLIPGIVIATVGFAEATAISRTFAVQDRERWSPSRELLGQGAANIAAAVSGGFPVGGSFSRSSINRVTGAQTRWSGAVTGLLVLGFMPFAGVMSDLPKAMLGAIVIFAIYHLVRVDEIFRMMKVSRGQAAVAGTTALATLLLAPRVDLAVLFGMLVAAGEHLYRESSELRIPATHEQGRLTLQPHGVLYYGSAGALYEALEDELAKHGECEIVPARPEPAGRHRLHRIPIAQIVRRCRAQRRSGTRSGERARPCAGPFRSIRRSVSYGRRTTPANRSWPTCYGREHSRTVGRVDTQSDTVTEEPSSWEERAIPEYEGGSSSCACPIPSTRWSLLSGVRRSSMETKGRPSRSATASGCVRKGS